MKTILAPAALLAFLILFALPAFPEENEKKAEFGEAMIWIQVGNQIKDVDEAMLDKLQECGFGKIVLLHSSVDGKGYFPKLKSIVKRAHARGIKVSVGTLVFKDAFQESHWRRHPELRHCSRDGKNTENKYYHYQICPNNPANHEYISSLMVRKARESGADEVHIDYEIVPCYCPYCLEKFKEDTGLDALSLDDSDPAWMTWRSRKTRDFFSVLARKCRTKENGLAISSTAPIIGFAGGFSAYGTDLRYEDLAMYSDEFQPMIYISVKNPSSMAGDKFEAIKIRLLGKKVVPGLIINEEFTSNIKTAERVMEELQSVFDKGASSIAIFEVRYINDELKELFKRVIKKK